MKKRLTVIAIGCALALTVCSTGLAQNLFTENFTGTEGANITSLGWTKTSGAAGDNVLIWTNTDVVALGQSGEVTAGNWVDYKKSLASTYTLGIGDVVELTLVNKTSYGERTSLWLEESGGNDAIWIGNDHRVGANKWIVKAGGSWYDIPFSDNGLIYQDSVVDLRVVMTTATSSFYWRFYGNPTWQLIGSYSGGMASVAKLGTESVDYGYSGLAWYDNISLDLIAGTLRGYITLDDWDMTDTDVSPVKIHLVPTSGGSERTATVFLLPGLYDPINFPINYTVDGIAPGTYDVYYSACTWLTEKVSPLTFNSNATLTQNVTLLNGDVNGDNAVSSTDLSVLLKNIDQVGD